MYAQYLFCVVSEWHKIQQQLNAFNTEQEFKLLIISCAYQIHSSELYTRFSVHILQYIYCSNAVG